MKAFTSDTVAGSPAGGSASPLSPAFLRMGDVLRLTGLARSTVYRLMAANGFPAPCRLGQRAIGWRSEDVAQWTATRPVPRR